MTRKNGAALYLSIACILAATPSAWAEVSFNGFGQIVVGSSLSNSRTFPSVDYSADPSFQTESLFALQVLAPLSDRLTATAQVVASGANQADFTPTFEWAYVSYQLNDTWSIKGGRQRLPLYRYSDYLEVGEAYPWIRPPLPVYQDYISNFDGLSLSGYYDAGSLTVMPQVIFGNLDKTATVVGQTFSFSLKDLTGLVVTSTFRNWINVRASYIWSKSTITNSALDPIADQVLPNSFVVVGVDPGPPPTPITAPANNTAAADGLVSRGDTSVFYSGGIEFTPGKFFLDAEYVGARFNSSALLRQNQYYVAAGYHLGKLTPTLTVGHEDNASSNPGVVNEVVAGSQCPVGINPTTGAPIVVDCRALVSTVVNTQRDLSDYYEVGVRYSLTNSSSLKVDFTRRLSHNPPGDSAGADLQHSANLLSAAFVFAF